MESGLTPGGRSTTTSPAAQTFPQDLFPLDFLSFIEGAGGSGTSPGPLSGILGSGQNDLYMPEAGPSTFPPQQQQQQQQQQSFQQQHSQSYISSPAFDGRSGNGNGNGNDGGNAGAGVVGGSETLSRGSSSRGRTRGKGSKRNSISSARGQAPAQGQAQTQAQGQGHSRTSSTSRAQLGGGGGMAGNNGGNYGAMEIDQDGRIGGMINAGMGLSSGLGVPSGLEGMEGFADGFQQQFAGMSQGMLQQFEGIHMQSPIVFDPNNPAMPYNPMAHFLASPAAQQLDTGGDGIGRKNSAVNTVGGLITPAASGEMFPQVRLEQMSPIQLEMLARREQAEGMPDLNMLPLLSPALAQHIPSQFASPVQNGSSSSGGYSQSQSPLEMLQEQQRQFQEQLNALQVQQRQLQATAAAVAASQMSPFVNAQPQPHPGSGGSSGQSRPVSTPGGVMGTGSAEPSPQYFSPLTSPALEATRHYHTFGVGVAGNVGGGGGRRQPHPLSALSSPALNPLGSSGGANQTLSPALHPQNNADLSDPDYLRALVGMLDTSQPSISIDTNHSRQGHSQSQSQSQFASPSHAMYSGGSLQSSPITQHQSGFTPLLGPVSSAHSASGSSNGGGGPSGGIGPGPNRQSLPLKSRPSPLIKPAHHRSHMRHPSTHTSFSQSQSQPSSPAVLKGIQPGTYLPPAAMMDQQRIHSGGSLTSTPSPVDLTQMMPPPPVPSAQKGLTPMTPAALMNLGTGGGGGGGIGRKPVLPKTEVVSAAAGTLNGAFPSSARNGSLPAQAGPSNIAGKNGARKVSGTGNGNLSIASNPGAAGTPAGTGGRKGQKIVAGKRVAARTGGVGVRAATKAAAAAAAHIPPEGETRRTSHKAAEQKRRDSLKAGFDELRLLLPPINTEALDPESGEPIPGSSAPRLLPKSSLVPDDNPNRGVSKVALLKFSNEYIVKLHEKVDKRDNYIERLRMEVERLRRGEEEEVRGEEGVDLLEYDVRAGEEEDEEEREEGDEEDELAEDDDEEDGDGEGGLGDAEDDEGMMEDDEEEDLEEMVQERRPVQKKNHGTGFGTGARKATLGQGGSARRPTMGRKVSSGTTVSARNRRGD